MAKAKKAVALNLVLLASVVAATQANSFVYTAEADHKPLIEAGLVEINPAMADENGSVATRATQKGIDQVNPSTEIQAAPVAASKPSFSLESGVPVPSVTGRGRTGNTYPFDLMEVGQSFFVANTEAKPNVAKSLASTVSSATARYSVASPDGATKTNKAGETVPVMVETRKFIVRSVSENGVGGARIWRTM